MEGLAAAHHSFFCPILFFIVLRVQNIELRCCHRSFQYYIYLRCCLGVVFELRVRCPNTSLPPFTHPEIYFCVRLVKDHRTLFYPNGALFSPICLAVWYVTTMFFECYIFAFLCNFHEISILLSFFLISYFFVMHLLIICNHHYLLKSIE